MKESQGENSEQGLSRSHGDMLLTDLLSLPAQLTFFSQPRTACLELILPTLSWALPHQTLFKKCLPPTGQSVLQKTQHNFSGTIYLVFWDRFSHWPGACPVGRTSTGSPGVHFSLLISGRIASRCHHVWLCYVGFRDWIHSLPLVGLQDKYFTNYWATFLALFSTFKKIFFFLLKLSKTTANLLKNTFVNEMEIFAFSAIWSLKIQKLLESTFSEI